MTHWAGCVLYYIALQEGLGAHTWLAIKPEFVASLGSFERRATSRAWRRSRRRGVIYNKSALRRTQYLYLGVDRIRSLIAGVRVNVIFCFASGAQAQQARGSW